MCASSSPYSESVGSDDVIVVGCTYHIDILLLDNVADVLACELSERRSLLRVVGLPS